MIKCLVNEGWKNGDQFMRAVERAKLSLNATENAAIGMSPIEAFIGKKPRLPIDNDRIDENQEKEEEDGRKMEKVREKLRLNEEKYLKQWLLKIPRPPIRKLITVGTPVRLRAEWKHNAIPAFQNALHPPRPLDIAKVYQVHSVSDEGATFKLCDLEDTSIVYENEIAAEDLSPAILDLE